MNRYQSSSQNETKRIGKKTALEIIGGRSINNRAVLIALSGELGSGKTTFVQGFFNGLKIKKRAKSPSFVIMRRMPLSNVKFFTNLFHIDAYRIKAKDILELGFKDLSKNPKNIILIEWADRIRRILPKSAIWIKFKYGQKRNEREIII